MSVNWNMFVKQDPWKYFNLPQEEEDRLRLLFTSIVGPRKITRFVDSILLDMIHDDPIHHPEQVIYGIGDTKQIAGAMLFIVGDFIAQYNKLGWRYKLPLLPKEIMGFFGYPYNLFQDLNLKNQYQVVKQLNKKYKRGLVIHGN